jgi:hypothetical protein
LLLVVAPDQAGRVLRPGYEAAEEVVRREE